METQSHMQLRVRVEAQAEKQYVCGCGGRFSWRQSLYFHKKTCTAPSLELVEMQEKVANLEKALAGATLTPSPPTQPVVATAAPPTIVDNRDQSHTVHFHGPVQINLHGKEDTTHLKEMLGQLLDSLPPKTDGKVILTKVAKMIYADPEHPQNVTTYIPNKRDNIPHVWTASGWEPRSEAEIYPAMVNRACDELQLKQEFELGYTPDGLVQLGVRSSHVRAAFDAETEAKDLKEAAHMFRPMLQGNKFLLTMPPGGQ
jgi:hypothetical protein